MSSEKNSIETRRWLETAVEDLDIADILFQKKKYSFSCFHSQQAGEKALKSILFSLGKDPWGHSLVRLIDELKDDPIIGDKIFLIRKEAMMLDRLYIPTRYPDGLPDITPMEAFSDNDAETALIAAAHFVELAKTLIVVS
jgi:HEPN domain-containing protein